MQSNSSVQINRRRLFSMIGAAAGTTVMYNAMARPPRFCRAIEVRPPNQTQGDPKRASVLILGAGVASMTATRWNCVTPAILCRFSGMWRTSRRPQLVHIWRRPFRRT